MAKVGRKKQEGDRHMYTVANDAHDFIMENGGGQYITNIVREKMKKNIAITTMRDLAEYINSHEDFPEDVEEIIAINGWQNDCGSAFGVCHSATEKVEFNDTGTAEYWRK